MSGAQYRSGACGLGGGPAGQMKPVMSCGEHEMAASRPRGVEKLESLRAHAGSATPAVIAATDVSDGPALLVGSAMSAGGARVIRPVES